VAERPTEPCLSFQIDDALEIVFEKMDQIGEVVNPFGLYMVEGHLSENGKKFWAALRGTHTKEEADKILENARQALKKAGLL